MDKLREAINRELSSVTLDSINRKFPEALPDRKENKMKISRKFAAIGAAAAVTAAALTITAGAVNDWDYGRAFRAFFPFSEDEKIEPVRGFMSEIPAECVTNTFTNYDVSVDGMIFDGYVLMVSSTISSKDGTPFVNGNLYYFEDEYNYNLATSSFHFYKPKDDGTLSVRNIFVFEERQETGGKMQFSLSSPYIYDEESKDKKFLEEGAVSFDLTLNERYETRNFNLLDGKNEMEIELSPLAMIVHSKPAVWEALSNAPWECRDGGYCKAIGCMEDMGAELTAYDADGNVLLGNSDIFSISVDEFMGTIHLSFREPIDADSVASIVWNNYK